MELKLEDVKHDFHANIKWGDSEWEAARYILRCLLSWDETYTTEAIDWFELVVGKCAPHMLSNDKLAAEELLEKVRYAISTFR